MKFVLPKTRLLEELFPKIENYKNLTEQDLAYIKEAYSYGVYTPSLEVADNLVTITIDVESIIKEEQKHDKAVDLCENGRLNEALVLVKQLIDSNPLISEYHRLKGQILSEQDSPKKAIDDLIEAVRLDPENTSALIMLGNIYSKQDDIDTAITFYERVLEVDPEDHLALNNIGGNLAKAGRLEEAKRYFDTAYEINPTYPNTIYGQALLASRTGDSREAFNKAIETLDHLGRDDNRSLFKQTFSLAQDEAVEVIKGVDSKKIIGNYINKLEDESGKGIKLETASDISTAAKLEIAEVHNREHHLVRYKPDRMAVEHLIMHELGHLELVLEAREINANKLFTTNNECRKAFEKDNKQYIVNSLEKQGVPRNKIDGFIDRIFQGLNLQIYNTPLDLFIEQRLYDRYSDLQPFQFMSLLKLIEDYITSATNEDVKRLVPQKVSQTNKILSLVNTIQFRDLYNLDLTNQFNPSKKELDEASELFKEWIAYFNDNEPAVEYKLVELWAKDFEVAEYFKLVDEEQALQIQEKDTIDQIESDPLALENQESVGKESFSNESSVAGEMSTTMYILDALKYFEDKSIEEIKKVGFEIGMLGRSGIDTDTPEQKYSLNSIPDKKFSGRHLLAYMYTAFQEFEPDLDTGLDFRKEYEQAVELFKQGH